MSERRFDDDEVREILDRATEIRETPALPASAAARAEPGFGLTLRDIQEVAAEVGISPERVAEAAQTLLVDRAALPTPRSQLGVPISVAHAVRLPRMLDSDEWDRFVVRLRDTFEAAGEVRTEGSLQTWSNGHLKVLLEPLDEGARLRFESLHNDAKQYLDGGVAMAASGLFLTAFLAILSAATGKPIPGPLFGLMAGLPAVGAGMWAVGRAKAAKWLPRRDDDFHRLGAEAQRVVSGGPGRIAPSGS